MITVERQLPRKSRIMRLVSAAAITPSNATPLIAARTNSDWSFTGDTLRLAGSVGFISSSFFLTPSTISSVEVAPFFRIDISTERAPLTCTMFVCGALPSRTLATSRM
jgi:hypothetical protein